MLAVKAKPTIQDALFQQHVVPEVDVLYRVAWSITRSGPDAEDLVQDTLVRAYRAIERFDGRHPRAWLLTIMRNAQVNRTRRRRPELMRDPDETMRTQADVDPSAEPEDTVLGAMFDKRVADAVAALAPKFQEVIEHVDMNGLSYQEAADLLDVPVGTVMSRLHRARRRVRDSLARQGITATRDLS